MIATAAPLLRSGREIGMLCAVRSIADRAAHPAPPGTGGGDVWRLQGQTGRTRPAGVIPGATDLRLRPPRTEGSRAPSRPGPKAGPGGDRPAGPRRGLGRRARSAWRRSAATASSSCIPAASTKPSSITRRGWRSGRPGIRKGPGTHSDTHWPPAATTSGFMSAWAGSPWKSSAIRAWHAAISATRSGSVNGRSHRPFAGILPVDRPSNRPFYDAIDGMIRCLDALGRSRRIRRAAGPCETGSPGAARGRAAPSRRPDRGCEKSPSSGRLLFRL